jgi:mono/diheme cytochrome c family protein
MLKYFLLSGLFAALLSCSNQSAKNESESVTDETYVPEKTEGAESKEEAIKKVDPNRGIGKFTNVELPSALDKAMATKGKEVYDVKCASCHRLTDERLVGPGWLGVTTRRTPEWIMNFSTNTDVMLNQDPEAQAMLEICLVRMPNQNLSDEDARASLEFMREIDGVK